MHGAMVWFLIVPMHFSYYGLWRRGLGARWGWGLVWVAHSRILCSGQCLSPDNTQQIDAERTNKRGWVGSGRTHLTQPHGTRSPTHSLVFGVGSVAWGSMDSTRVATWWVHGYMLHCLTSCTESISWYGLKTPMQCLVYSQAWVIVSKLS